MRARSIKSNDKSRLLADKFDNNFSQEAALDSHMIASHKHYGLKRQCHSAHHPQLMLQFLTNLVIVPPRYQHDFE